MIVARRCYVRGEVRHVVRLRPRVDAYIEGLTSWHPENLSGGPGPSHAADPEVTETIKRSTQSCFVLQGNVCALLAAKDHENIFLYGGAIVPDLERIITRGHNNKTARTSPSASVRGSTRALNAMFPQIIANNRAGWRKLKPSG
jgi:hypothetical protein